MKIKIANLTSGPLVIPSPLNLTLGQGQKTISMKEEAWIDLQKNPNFLRLQRRRALAMWPDEPQKDVGVGGDKSVPPKPINVSSNVADSEVKDDATSAEDSEAPTETAAEIAPAAAEDAEGTAEEEEAAATDSTEDGASEDEGNADIAEETSTEPKKRVVKASNKKKAKT